MRPQSYLFSTPTKQAMNQTLSEAVTTFKTLSRSDPFGTWLIIENKEHLKAAERELGAAALRNHLTTPLDLGTVILKAARPGTRIIKTEEQFLIFAKTAASSGLGRMPDATTENIISLYTLLTTNIKTLSNTTPKLAALNSVFSRYKEWCTKNNCTDKITAISEAVRNVSASGLSFANVLYYGRPKEGTLNAALIAALGSVRIFEPPEYEAALPPELCEAVIYSDYKKELNTVFEKIACLLEAGTDPQEIVLLYPSLTEITPYLIELAEDYSVKAANGTRRPLTFSTEEKIPVINSPVVRPVIALLACRALGYKTDDLLTLLGASCFRKNRHITIGELKSISIRLGISAGKNDWEKVEKRLNAPLLAAVEREKTAVSGKPERIKKYLSAAEYNTAKQAAITALIESTETGGKTWKERAEALERTLEKLGWMKNRPTSAAEQSAAAAFLRMLTSIPETSLADTPCTEQEFFKAVSHFCSTDTTTGLLFSGFRIAPVSAASENMADYVFAAGLTSAKLPRFDQTLPLLTAEESAALWPDRISDSLTDQEKTFAELLVSAKKELHLSCAEKGSRKNTTPSPYLTKITPLARAEEIPLLHSRAENQKLAGKYMTAGEEEKCRGLFGLTSPADAAKRIQTESVDREGAAGIFNADFSASDLQKTFAEEYDCPKEGFAPTTLESYVQCPFKWYLKHHLRLASPQDESSEAKILGSAVHRALERFFKNLPAPVTALTRDAALASLRECIADEMKQTGITSPSWQARLDLYLGTGGLSRTLENLIERECSFSAEGYKTPPDCIEQKITAHFEQDGQKMTINGYADRIMKKDNQTFAVADYKTGKIPEAAYALQLPLYLRAVEQKYGWTGTDGYYLQVKPDAAFAMKKLVTGEADIQETVDLVVQQCFAIREKMMQGICSVTQEAECPDKYCDYRRICRHRPAPEDENGTD